MRKVWDIHGGVHPPENKSQSTQTPIAQIPLPKEVVIPLGQHIGAEAIPTVKTGDRVLKGQKIADAQGTLSAPVHASSSGTVIAIEPRAIPHTSGLEAICVVVALDGQEEWIAREEKEDYLSIDKCDLVDMVRNAGIAGMGGAGFPTSVKLNPRADQTIDTLILNGTECEPYITADDVLMRERAEDIISGALLCAYILGEPKEILVGIEDNKPEAIESMRRAAEGTRVEIVAFPTKYPSGGEKQLIQILTGREVPSGSIPAAIGVVVQNVGTVAAAYRAVRFGEPLISRVTTIVGEALGVQQNIETLIGTPISHILEHHEFKQSECARLIIGGPMMGFAMQNAEIPVVKTTNCILVPSHQEMPNPIPAQPCIRCGMCSEACPAGLLPQQLFWFSQSEDIDKLKSHNLFDCIECGACSYVCPSNIPLVQYYRASKGMIKQIDQDKLKSDRSRDRFEFRKERLAKAEAEKEAKRLARKKAAEEAKKNIAKQGAAAGDKNTAGNTAEETKPAQKEKPADPSVTLKKLERAVSSAQSRVERAKAQIEKAKAEGEKSRLESLEARLKQAELNLRDAEEKLAQNGQSTPGNEQAQAIKEKVALSPKDKLSKSVETLKQRIETATQKYEEAQSSGSPTASALKTGLEKLQAKLTEAEQELNALEHAPAQDEVSDKQEDATHNAAATAIAKAQAKAEAMAGMSDEEKAAAQIESLKTRLEKAQARLQKAEAENNEHIDAFRSSVEKLEKKLQEAIQ